MISKFLALNYKIHLLISLATRLILICYGEYHDKISDVPYTDIDYKVFTDASRHILAGNSPYLRHTYRYSPLLALILVPNILLHHTFGKLLFSLVDILVGLLVRDIVKNSIKEYETVNGKTANKFLQNIKSISYEKKGKKKNKNKFNALISDAEAWANLSMLSWLYNPLTIAISTRGNSDSLACAVILLTLYFLQYRKQYFTAGLLHGFAIHFRLFPIIYSLSYFMFLSSYSYYSVDGHTDEKDTKSRKTIFKKQYLMYFWPNKNQLMLVCGCALSLVSLTSLFYCLYGFEFLYETYIYHFVRTDPRHSFSLYFYLQYLTAWVKNIGLWQKVLTILPQVNLLLVFSIRYGLNRVALNFAVLTQTIVMVIYNRVITSQYFVWIMGILPLCLWQIKMSRKMASVFVIVWFLAQGAWLLPAYLLEFRGQNTFMLIWLQSVGFFCVNIAILGRMIMYFMPVVEKKL